MLQVIPSHTQESLDRYFNHGYMPGSFCEAILVGDLYGAFARADYVNRSYIPEIVEWVLANAPYGSFGSVEHVHGWIDKNVYFQNHQKVLVVNILTDDSSA